ncbi:MAG: GspH/FimT family pseudopilin [Acidobacteria bacterium]|nr:GspH/FimT family pseudopilin [Acidobacteriota bacterium]
MANIRFKKSRGFSAVELVMVLAMTGIIAAFAIPVLTNSMRGMQLISDARKIATTMSYAKLSATSQMTSYRISFDLDNDQWSLLKRNRTSGNFELQQAVNQLSDGVANSQIAFKTASGSAPAGFSTNSSTDITFNARGIPNGIGIIYLSNEDADFAVSVSLAGKVQLWRYQDNQWAPI